jgi:hypothetical protein
MVRSVNSAPLLVNGADVRATENEVTLILSAAGVHVMFLRLRHEALAEEMINSAGLVATGAVKSWTLINQELSLELNRQAATVLGFPRDLRMRLNVDAATLGRAGAALMEILEGACFIMDTADGCVTG